MFFSLPILGQALLWTMIIVAAVFAVRFVVARKAPSARFLGITAGASFVVNLIYTYCAMPAHTGSMYGLWGYLLITLIALFAAQAMAYIRADSSRPRRWDYNSEKTPESPDLKMKPFFILGALAVFVLIAVPVGQIFLHKWPFGDAKQWAAQANITIASPEEKLPQTDNRHIVLVDREVAAFLAQAKLGEDNLGSKYTLEKEDFVKQSIAGHLYWVCPLEYKSAWTQFWDAVSGSQSFPGFVIVDAENPDPSKVRLIHNLDLKYTNGAMFGHNVTRYLYGKGYTTGNLDFPLIELNDELKPYLTVTYTRPKFVVGGEEMVSVLVIDMQTGEVNEYAPDKIPAWVDRVVSEDMATNFANYWGKYHHEQTGWTTGTFNGGAFQMRVDHVYMAYNTVDAPVYHIAMTSNDDRNRSATGILVYDTRAQKGTFYPGLAGINLDNAVTFKNIADNQNGAGSKEPSEIGLYNVNGQTTWIAIYTAPQRIGRSFAGIGMMDAHNPSSTSVAYGDNKTVSLRRYETYLGNINANGAQVKNGQEAKKVSGTVAKANWVNGKLYLVLVEDPTHRYAATQDVIGGGDLVEVVVGEKIALEYKDFGAREVEVTAVTYDPAQKQK